MLDGIPSDRRVVTTGTAGRDGSMTRRSALSVMALSFAASLNLGWTPGLENATRERGRSPDDPLNDDDADNPRRAPMHVHYLEIVTTDVETICSLYSEIYGVPFGDADQDLGGARTARLTNGGMLGVRAPLNDGERPVVRPYVLVDDIEAAVAAAAESGAEVTLPPMPIPNHGRCAIVSQGGIESGLWQA